MMLSTGIIFLLVVIFFVIIASGGYWWGRRKNMLVAKSFSAMFEKVFSPVEKNYIWIGGLIGFHANYILSDNRWMRISLIMPARHSLIYYPFSLLLGGRERIFISMPLNKDSYKGDLIQKGAKLYDRKLIKVNDHFGFLEQQACVKGSVFSIRSTHRTLFEAFKKILQSPHASLLQQVSIGENNKQPQLYIYLRCPHVQDFERVIKVLEPIFV